MVQVSSNGSLGRFEPFYGTYSVWSYTGTVHGRLQVSVSQNTASVYRQTLQCINVRQQSSFQQIWPPPVDHIDFIAYLSETGLFFSSAGWYPSGVSFVINLHSWLCFINFEAALLIQFYCFNICRIFSHIRRLSKLQTFNPKPVSMSNKSFAVLFATGDLLVYLNRWEGYKSYILLYELPCCSAFWYKIGINLSRRPLA